MSVLRHDVIGPTRIFTASKPNGNWASAALAYHCFQWQALCRWASCRIDPAVFHTLTVRKKLASLLSRSTTSAVAAVTTAVVVVLSFFWLSVDQAASVDGASVLIVGDARYEFAPSVCTVTSTDFVAAGRGTVDGEPFWVSASSRSIRLSVGTDSELQRPSAGELWFTSVGELVWNRTSGLLQVQTLMRDGRNDGAAELPAQLSVSCPTAT